MPSEELVVRVKALLAREWNVARDDIPDSATINEFPQWDSIGHITIMLALESEFGVAISAESVQELTTLPRILRHLETFQQKAAAR